MADFKPEDFLEGALTRSKVSRLLRKDLEELIAYLELTEAIPVQDLLKPALVEQCTDHLIKLGFFGEDACQEFLAKEKKAREEAQAIEHEKEKEAQAIEREKEKAERVEREKKAEREHAFRLRELELTAARSGVNISTFSVAQQVRLVPKFNERDVEKYFLAFEKTATTLKWPKDQWTMLLQTALSGKALDAYSALPIANIADYDMVKAEILRTYELVPEAYRQKFRKLQKGQSVSYVEFAREKRILFERWLESQKIESDFDKLCEIILLEEFKNSISHEICLHLEDRKIDSLAAAATAADEYVLVHKVSLSNQGSVKSKGKQNGKPASFDNDKTKDGGSEPAKSESGTKSKKWFKSPWFCDHCKKRGHTSDRCYILHPELKQVKSESQPVGFVKHMHRNESGISSNVFDKRAKSSYDNFKCGGFISQSNNDDKLPVVILRDTGSAQSLVLEDVIQNFNSNPVGHVWVQGIGCQDILIPLHEMWLGCEYFNGKVTVGAVSKLPMKGVNFLLGNDIAGGQVNVVPKLNLQPCVDNHTEILNEEFPGIFPACVTTRSMKVKESLVEKQEESKLLQSRMGNDEVILAETFMSDLSECSVDDLKSDAVLNQKGLYEKQCDDDTLKFVRNQTVSYDEIYKFPVCYYWKGSVLMRKWRPSDVPADESWHEVHQVVLPESYRTDVIRIAHELPLSGHLGVRKTQGRILKHFYWPGVFRDIAEFCRTCSTCQVVGKPNQVIKPAPLIPIPAVGNPFDSIIIDCVGPLPKTKSGNCYLLTIMDSVTRFPEAIPLRKITTKFVVDALIQFFTRMGLAKEIRSDQGSNFTSGLFQEVLRELGIKHKVSSAYRPQTQGALERFHQTLKTMLKTYCHDNASDWDKGVDLLLFAIREVPNESLGYSPFELVYGHEVRGPMKMFKEKLLSQDAQKPVSLSKFVSSFKTRLHEVRELAKTHLHAAQCKMKVWYDRKARSQEFKPDDEVLLLLPQLGHALQTKFCGPYKVLKKLNSVDYLIHTPDRKKSKRVCHVNMIKPYHVRATPVSCVNVNENGCQIENSVNDDVIQLSKMLPSPVLNSEAMLKIAEKLCHLSEKQQCDVTQLFSEFDKLFSDVPGRTTRLEHDIVLLEGTTPIKQHPYRLNPIKLAALQKEIDYMLKNDIIEPSESPWCNPVIMVPKSDQTYRMCVDLRKVNCVTKTDSHPIPRIEDCIDRLGKAKYISKFDLLKGYWQVPLTERSKEITAFATPDHLYQFKVMCFGLKNAPSSFSRLMCKILTGLDGCTVFIDDVAICSDSWESHLDRIRALFQRLSEANLTINLGKSEIGHAFITYLGHQVGQGKVLPKEANVEAIDKLSVPTSRKEVMKFLGTVGYYRKFCRNFSEIAAPLTNLLQKNKRFEWSGKCQLAFESLKQLLMKPPVLLVPDYNKQFKLLVDACDIGTGAVLMQKGEDGLDHPLAYFSRKLNKHQVNYSTIEKETLALVLAVQHFEIYISAGTFPVMVFTDHNPLRYLNQFKNKNRRLTRWSLYLQEYDLHIQHIAGKENILADSLSRVS
jgi:hypothetical protein